jgi:hypothetical protein
MRNGGRGAIQSCRGGDLSDKISLKWSPRNVKMVKNDPRNGHSAGFCRTLLHAPRMMGTEMAFEVRNGSRVDASHTIGTIHDCETCHAAGCWAGDGDYPIARQFVSLWSLAEIKKGVAVSGVSLSHALVFSDLN